MRDAKANAREDHAWPAGPLPATKFSAPPLRAGLVARARLLDRVAECTRRRLTLLTAPAGSGKTTLLAQWGAAPREHAVAWLAIDAADDAPVHFFRLLTASVEAAIPGAGSGALALLRSSFHPSARSVAAALLNDLTDRERDLVLVLDGYHLIGSGSIHDAMALVLDRLPPSLHLVVASRTSPPLPLARLRALGDLGEIRASDLRFTMEEATAFLEGTAGLRLAPGAAEALAARTEGWGAGLQLAALWAQGREEPEPSLAAFTGSQHLVVDYLGEEVFRREPPDVQAFLLRTSILERLSAPLCDAVTGGAGPRQRNDERAGPSFCQRMLERVERENLFLVPFDEERRWWRYHRLFREFLRRRLEEERREELLELHRRAAIWLEENGFAAEAAGHAIEVRDFERAARLIEEAGTECLGTTPPSTLLRWFGALPRAILRSRPALRVMEAWASFRAGQVEVAEERLREAARAAPRAPLLQGWAITMRAYVAVMRGEGRSAVQLSSRALRRLPRREARARNFAHLTLGLAHESLGDLEAARRSFRRAQALAQVGDGIPWLYSTTMLAALEYSRGELREAAQLYDEALRLAPWGGEWAPPPVALPHLGLGELSYQWNDLGSAARHLDAAIEIGIRSETSDCPVVASMLLAHVRQSQRDGHAARRLAGRADRLIRCGARVTPWSINMGRALQARLWLRQGDVESAARWAESGARGAWGVFQDDRNAVHVAWVRVMLALGRPEDVARPLQRWLRAARSAGRAALALELEVLWVLALAVRGDTRAALAGLDEALARARPEGWSRLFLDEGEPMARLLEQAARRRSATAAYARGLLAASASDGGRRVAPAPPPNLREGDLLIEPLGKREREILSLIAEGLSNPQIAGRLLITVATVKTHINNLYGKLGVRSRIDAVMRARRLGIA
jgi:LuxR family maltose regulon positive regulatory protein